MSSESEKLFASRFQKKSSTQGFAEAARVKSIRPIYFVRSKASDGRAEWFIIEIEPIKEKAFLKALDGKDFFDLKDFGLILYSGYGNAPPESLQRKLVEEGVIDPIG